MLPYVIGEIKQFEDNVDTVEIWINWKIIRYLNAQFDIVTEFWPSDQNVAMDAFESFCGSVGRAVAFDTRSPRFNTSWYPSIVHLIKTVLKRRKCKVMQGMADSFKCWRA